jgi:hypothetical protein
MRKPQKVAVTVQMCVAQHPRKDEKLVDASWGLGKGWSPWQVVQTYRKRFGIEVKYRQMGQCLAATTSGNERVRLLLLGVALLLCNVWAYLHSEVYSLGVLGERRLRLSLCRLRVLCRDLAAVIATYCGQLARSVVRALEGLFSTNCA